MKLYIIRHGQALDASVDSERPLSPEGRREASNLAAYLRKKLITVSEIWQSEKLRAQQTAAILESEGSMSAVRLTRPGLAPMDNVGPVADEIGLRNEDLCLVGHLPFVSRLASLMLSGDEEQLPVGFGSCCMLPLERKPHGQWLTGAYVDPASLGTGQSEESSGFVSGL